MGGSELSNLHDYLVRTFHRERKKSYVSVAEYSRRGWKFQSLGSPADKKSLNTSISQLEALLEAFLKAVSHDLEVKALDAEPPRHLKIAH